VLCALAVDCCSTGAYAETQEPKAGYACEKAVVPIAARSFVQSRRALVVLVAVPADAATGASTAAAARRTINFFNLSTPVVI
jgi:hypothetical protein